MPDIELRPCDIIATKSYGWLGRAIRFFTRRIGESRSNVNHVGIITHGGSLEGAIVVEALSRVIHHPLWEGYGYAKAPDIAIFRPLNLTEDEREVIRVAAEQYVGRKYGFLKIATHLADWVLQGAYIFRRLSSSDNYPICSWVVAQAYAHAGKDFGVQAGAASPDDIWDFCLSHPEKYAVIVPLGNLVQFRRELQ
jgi:hypothetical protein